MAEGSVLKNIALLAVIGIVAKIIVMSSIGTGNVGTGFWVALVFSVLIYSACDLLAWIKVEFDIQKITEWVDVFVKTIKPRQ